MAEIPDMALIFIRQYQTCLYIRGSYHMGLKVFNSLPTYIKDISSKLEESKCLLKKNSLFKFFLHIGVVFPI